MATRTSSRRSAGGSDGFNRAMVNLLPYARLKEECEKRGLPTDGNKQTLSARLEDSLDGIYVHPSPTVNVATTPTTSRTPSTATTPKTRESSAKGPSSKKTPRRRNSAGDDGAPDSTSSPLKKKVRRNSTKKGEIESRECSQQPKEGEIEHVIEEDFSVTIVTAGVGGEFDSEDDLPLISVPKAEEPTTSAVSGDSRKEEKEKRKNKRQIKEEDDLETGAVLSKGDSEWIPPEESERRSRKDSAKKRTRRNTMEAKGDDEGKHEDSSLISIPVLDPEIYDQEGVEEQRHDQQLKTRNGSDVKSTPGESGKKSRKDSSSSAVLDRPRSISMASSAANAAATAVKERRESAAATSFAARPPKEKPATQLFAEMMAQKKRDAESARMMDLVSTPGNGESGTVDSLISTGPGTSVVKKEEMETSGDESPLTTDGKMELSGRRISTGLANSPSTGDTTTKGGFSMTARKNAPLRQSAGGSDLLGDLLGKQTMLLEKRVTSTAQEEAEKIRIVSQIKQRAPDLRIREGTVKEEKERWQKEKEEREKLREERERRERERKAAVISAPSRPIPPPPPPLPMKLDGSRVSPQEEGMEVDRVIKQEDEGSDTMETGKDTEVPNTEEEEEDPIKEPEYEPLSPGPSMPPLDRSIADAHRRERKERMERLRREEWRQDHGLVARETPSEEDPFLMRLSDKLKMIKRQRDISPIPDEIRECLEDMIKKVEMKVEKEMKWERRTKRKTEYQEEREKEEAKKRAEMMRDPRALLAKATNILESMHGNGSMDEDSPSGDSPSDSVAAAARALQISQHLAEPGTYEEDTDDRPLPEFHGEPVPSDDEEAIFLEAAGLPRKDKKPKHPVIEEEAPPSHEHILMDYYNACLNIKSATDKEWIIEPDNENGLALMWGGVRTNHGYILPWTEEKKCLVYQVKILEHQSIRHLPFMEQEPYDVRVGFSLRQSTNILGESNLSWAFSTTGKKCANNIFQDWGDPIEIGDVVTAVMDFSTKSISFYKNNSCMGVAFKGIALPDVADAIYAHVCVKNCKIAVNLGSFPEVEGGWGTMRETEWIFPSEIEKSRFEMSRLPPNEKAACTLLMMVGLPGVGKSTWVRQYIRDHPEEQWDVINAEGVMAAMKVNGMPRGRTHTGRWDMVLGLVAKALQKMVLLAARRRRNYIVDLSNVNKDSRKRRLMHFKDFTKKCLVIVPDEEEMVNRQMKQTRQEGASHVPAEAILEMKAVFTFPCEEAEGLDEVHLIEPPMPRIAEAIEIIQKFNDEGKPWYQKRYRGRGSRRGGRGGFMGGDRRASDFGRPLSVSTAASNGSGPPTNVGDGGRGRSMASPGAWGISADSPSTSGHFSWATRKAAN
ncbi:hypothetical protein PFISCL1PPCAC_24882 [Pristionchus fissidentatus]|uniref:Uncharacterized protein n=1 Tax=Pristionchus fissidentatus TaxID=1538716 RepID=A0AAV5WSQ1_9BILA|nr:hypothetical protein PFISCL1PPCAC_24882 [Pristionchus fissidentatus]